MSKLIELRGKKLTVSEVPKFTWNADLIDFDGPLLSLFKQSDGQDALFAWLDCDSRRNRWCVIPVSREDLWNYLNGKVSLRSLILGLRNILVFNMGTTASRRTFVALNSLPREYLPDSDSFLTPEISTPAAKKLVSERAQDETLILVGEEIYLEDLEAIPKLYQQLYSYHYGMEHLGRPAVRDAVERLMSQWHGGIGAVNLFSGLKAVTPSIHRARIVELRYNSPGVIRMSLLPFLADRIKFAMRKITKQDDFKDSEDLYNQIYAYFREHKISGFDDERSVLEMQLLSTQVNDLKFFVGKFFKIMGWEDYTDNFVNLEITVVSQLRMLLAYYRRLRRLREFIISNKLRIE